MNEESYKEIDGLPGYLVGNQGSVLSVRRAVPVTSGGTRTIGGLPLKQFADGAGYLRVNLSKGGKQRQHLVHRLVLTAFVGPCPDGMETRHLNGDPSDNRIENLVWGTAKENAADRISHGTQTGRSAIACKRGHTLLDERNLVPSKLKIGRRNCLACNRAQRAVARSPHPKPDMSAVSDEYYRDLLT